MRHFHSYGPVDDRYHFCVRRQEMISRCTEQLVGIPGEGGHFFTIWAPRQTGKARYVAMLNMNAVTLVLFTPVEDETVLKKLSDTQEIDGVKVTTEAVGWI